MSAPGMASRYEPRVPDGVDVTRPSIARIYDYLLYGKDNFAVDRAAAEKLMESRLEPRRLSLANRAFLRRAVRFLARQGYRFAMRGYLALIAIAVVRLAASRARTGAATLKEMRARGLRVRPFRLRVEVNPGVGKFFAIHL